MSQEVKCSEQTSSCPSSSHPPFSTLIGSQTCVRHLTDDVSEGGFFPQVHSSSKAILLILVVFASDHSKTGM